MDCQAYDDDGNFDGEYEDEQSLDVVEAYSCIKDISLSYCSQGGMIAKVQLILTYLSDKNISSYESEDIKIEVFGELNDF